MQHLNKFQRHVRKIWHRSNSFALGLQNFRRLIHLCWVRNTPILVLHLSQMATSLPLHPPLHLSQILFQMAMPLPLHLSRTVLQITIPLPLHLSQIPARMATSVPQRVRTSTLEDQSLRAPALRLHMTLYLQKSQVFKHRERGVRATPDKCGEGVFASWMRRLVLVARVVFLDYYCGFHYCISKPCCCITL
jgi:hypothetical protein